MTEKKTTKTKTKPMPISKIEEAEAYFVTDKGVFHPSAVKIQKDQDRKESKQLKEKEEKFLLEEGLVSLPFNVNGLLWLMDNSEYFDACVHQIAQDVVSRGHELRVKEGKKENSKEREKIESFLDEPNFNEDESFEKLVKNAVLDLEVIGWFGIELSRDEKEPTGLWNVPAHTIRVHENKKKFCQKREGRKVWFKTFGYEKDIDMETGEEKETTDNPANELIYYKEFNQQSDYYGRPPILPAVGAARGLVGIRDYNLAFFENYGIPLGWILLEGKWKKGTEKKLNNFWNTNIKGAENAHKVMILRTPSEQTIKWIPLESKQVKEGSFEKLEIILRNKILVPYRMPPYRIGIAETGSLGGSTAKESSEIYADSVINPLKADLGRLFTRVIIRGCFKNETYDLVFKELDVRDLLRELERYQKKFEMATITPIQIMEKLGIAVDKDLKENELLNQYYISSKYRPVDEGFEKEAGIIGDLQDLKREVEEAIRENKK